MEELLIKKDKANKNHNVPVEKIDWDNLLETSDYLALLEIQKAFLNGNHKEVRKGLEGLVELFHQTEKVDVQELLQELMELIISAKINTELFRKIEWAASIRDIRKNIAYRKNVHYFDINNEFLQSIWKETFDFSKSITESKLKKNIELENLSWGEVFDTDYLKKL